MADRVQPACRIVIDVFEDRTVADVLVARGVDVEFRRLPVADYVLPRRVMVERKTVHDLHQSVVRGRFWRQIGAVRRAASFGYLIVEGVRIDEGPLAANAVRAVCLAVIGQGVGLLRTEDARDSARWLHLLAERQRLDRTRRERPVYGQRPRSRAISAAEAVLGAVPGISSVTARRLLEHFGSVERIAAAPESDLRLVDGVGPTRAAALQAALTANR